MFNWLAEEGRITLPLQETNPRIRIGTPKTAGFSGPSPKFTRQKVPRMRGVALPLAAAPPLVWVLEFDARPALAMLFWR